MTQITPETDTIKIRIEEDGTITMVTGKMGAEVHHSAEEFIEEVCRITGGSKEVEHLAHKHRASHVHKHDQDHIHIGE